jgi:hypothetical protein
VKQWIDERTGKPKIIYHLCADTGSDTKYYAQNGYDVRLVGSKIGVENVHGHENVYGIIANPVCTEFSIAMTTRPRDLEKGMFLVKECLRFIWECQYFTPSNERKGCLKFWSIENPATGLLRYFLGKPAYEYCPSEFGANYSKRTALWGIFIPPPKDVLVCSLPSNASLCNKRKTIAILNKSQGMEKNSVCYDGFAKLFYYANP